MSVVQLSQVGAQQVAQQIGALSSAVEQLAARQAANTRATQASARANTSASASMQSFAQSAQNGVQRIQGIAGAVQGLVSQLGSTNRTAGLIASVAGATAQFAAMGSMLGPAGTVAGGLVGLATGLISVTNELNDVETAALEARQEIQRLAAARITARTEASAEHGLITGDAGGLSESDLATRGEEARLRARGAEDEIARLRAALDETGTGSHGIEYSTLTGAARERAEAALEAARETLREQNAIVDGVRREVDARADAAREAEHMAELAHREADFLSSEAAAAAGAASATAGLDERNRARRDRRGGGGGDSRADDLAETYRRWEAEEDAFYGARDAAAFEATIAAIEAERERGEALLETKRELAASELELERAKQDHLHEIAEEQRALEEERRNEVRDGLAEFSHETSRSLNDVISSYRELQNQAKETGVELRNSGLLMSRGMVAVGNQISDVVGNQMTSAFSSALGAWLDGSKSFVEAAEEMAKGVIKALVQESIVQGVTELARGIADLASYRYDSAALHFAAAAAWAAVGGVAGAIGAATGAFGGGKSSEGASSRDGASADRERSRDQQSGPTVVNLYYDGLPATQSEVASGVRRGLRTAQRHGYLPAGALTG